jgi:hypothetical protein
MRELYQAITKGDYDRVEELIAQGVDLNQKMDVEKDKDKEHEENWLPLHLAIEYEMYRIAKLLVCRGANLFLPYDNGYNYDEVSVLHKPIKDGEYQFSEWIIESGYPVDDAFFNNPRNLTRQRLLLKYHDSYIPRDEDKLILDFIQKGDIKAITMITKKGLITSDKIDRYLEHSIKNNQTQITNYLLHLKQTLFGFNDESYEL